MGGGKLVKERTRAGALDVRERRIYVARVELPPGHPVVVPCILGKEGGAGGLAAANLRTHRLDDVQRLVQVVESRLLLSDRAVELGV